MLRLRSECLASLARCFFAIALGGTAAACASRLLTLQPGEAAELNVSIRPGLSQMIELEGTEAPREGAEVVLTVGEINLPPIYFSPAQSARNDKDSVIAARFWSPFWPLETKSRVRIANYGPSPMTLRRIHVEQGTQSDLQARAEAYAPFPPLGWIDLKEILTGEDSVAPEESVLDQITAFRAWRVQRQRRRAFERIEGLAPALRMGERIIGDVQVRACLLGSRGAVVGLSRPDRSSWRTLGPDWIPTAAQAQWVAISKGASRPRRFEVQDSLMTLAFFISGGRQPALERHADPDPSTSVALEPEPSDAIIEARLYRMDSVRPVAAAEWHSLGEEGRWLEMNLDPPLEPGEYVLELRAPAGTPMWLAWAPDPARGPNPARNPAAPIETLITQEGSGPAADHRPISARVFVVGSATPVERWHGSEATSREEDTIYRGNEIVLEADLGQGETELFYLRNYRSSVEIQKRIVDGD